MREKTVTYCGWRRWRHSAECPRVFHHLNHRPPPATCCCSLPAAVCCSHQGSRDRFSCFGFNSSGIIMMIPTLSICLPKAIGRAIPVFPGSPWTIRGWGCEPISMEQMITGGMLYNILSLDTHCSYFLEPPRRWQLSVSLLNHRWTSLEPNQFILFSPRRSPAQPRPRPEPDPSSAAVMMWWRRGGWDHRLNTVMIVPPWPIYYPR